MHVGTSQHGTPTPRAATSPCHEDPLPACDKGSADCFVPNAGADDAQPTRRPWSVLVYSAADNSLKGYQYDDLDEMEQVGSTPDMAVVAQYDGGRRVGCHRYEITADHQEGKVSSPEVGSLGKHVDMGDGATLADFVTWGMQQYPAEHTMLIVSSHGFGWRGGLADRSNLGWMSLPEMKAGLEQAQAATGKKLDVIGFDACMMGAAEVAYELKDQAAFIVASEKSEGDNGWPYPRLLSGSALASLQAATRDEGGLGPRQMAERVVSTASAATGDLPTMAAYDTSRLGEVGHALDTLGKAILDTSIATRWHLRRDAALSQGFTVYKDLCDFAERIIGDTKFHDARLRGAAAGVLEAVKSATVAEEHASTLPHAHGMSVDLLTSWLLYRKLDLARDTHWDEATRKLRSLL